MGWYLTGRNLSPKQMRVLSMQAFIKGKEYAQMLGKKLPKPRLGKRKRDRLLAAQKKPELAQGEIVISKTSSDSQVILPGESTAIKPSITPEPAEISSSESLEANQAFAGKPLRAKRQRISWRKNKEAIQPDNTRICSQCRRASSADASFCQYCGNQFTSQSF
jgi:hypothetical protein